MKNNNTNKNTKKNSKSGNAGLTPRQLVAKKNNTRLGKPPGTTSTVLLQPDVIQKLAELKIPVPVSYRFCKNMNLEYTPFKSTTQNINEVVKPAQNNSVVVTDLNQEPEQTEVAATA